MLINHFKEEDRERCVVESFQVCLRWSITVPVLRRNTHFLSKNMTVYWSRLLILELLPPSNLQWKDVSTTFLNLLSSIQYALSSFLPHGAVLGDWTKHDFVPVFCEQSSRPQTVPQRSSTQHRHSLAPNSSKWPIESQGKEWRTAGVCLVERSVTTELA